MLLFFLCGLVLIGRRACFGGTCQVWTYRGVLVRLKARNGSRGGLGQTRGDWARPWRAVGAFIWSARPGFLLA